MTSRLDRAGLARLLCAAMALTFLAHGFCFFNPTYSGESMMLSAAKGRSAQMAGGQYLLPLYWAVRGTVSSPLWVGLISTLCLACTALLIADLLGLRAPGPFLLLVGVLGVNAGATSLFAAGLHTADAAFLAQLLAAAGMYLSATLPLGFAPGALLIAGAAGLHPNAPACAGALCVLALMRALCAQGQGPRHAARCIPALAAGLALYAAGMIAVLRLRGIGCEATLHLSASPAEAWLAPIRALLSPLTIYGALNLPLRAALWLCAACALAVLARRLSPARTGALIALALALPLAANLPAFSEKAPGQFPLSFAYADVLLLLLLSHVPSRRVRRGAACALAVLLLGQGIFANQVYLKKNLEYTSTLSVMTRVIDRAEQTEGFDLGSTPVAIIGTLDDSALSIVHAGFEHLTALDAAQSNYAPVTTQDMIWYCWEVLGYPFNFASTYDMEQIALREDVRAMPAYPHADSCRLIDGTLVIKLSK